MAERGVASVDRALAIIAVFGDHDKSLTLAELARRTGLYKSTILRLAASLERARYLRRSEDGRFALGPALLRLGELYQASFELEEVVVPVLRRLSASTGESSSLYVREGDVKVCLFRVNSMVHRVLHYLTPGSRLEVASGASGRILLAFTEPDDPAFRQEREHLLAVSSTRRKSETSAVACPVFGPREGFVGAMSLAGPSHRFTNESIASMSEILLHEARTLSEDLGGSWPPARPGEAP